MKLKALGWILIVAGTLVGLRAEVVRVATYNVQNYLEVDRWVEERYRPGFPKPETEKAVLRKVILEVDPDILVLQEMGPDPYLGELQADLKAEGLDLPFRFVARGADEERHVALLSRIQPSRVLTHKDLKFEYFGETTPVKRGMLEAVFHTRGYEWKLFGLHLKSKWSDYEEDPQSSDRRRSEALACRARIQDLQRQDGLPFLILGDLNDTKSTAPVRLLQFRGKVEVAAALEASDSRGDRWTHYYHKEDSYARIDYILKSPDFPARVVGDRAHIRDGPQVLKATDHRLVWVDLDWGGGR